ncbi:MAG TPA: hypothetical protein DCL73_09500 [Treponema sp.]|nr:hypothetical protein [Treponema sp.]
MLERCVRCELEKLQSLMTPAYIAEVVAGLPEEKGVTADKSEYERRMNVCGTCEAFSGGMLCTYSGSYPAYRAHVLASLCPYPGSDKWKNTDF